MRDVSLHLIDIAMNSAAAGADNITIGIKISRSQNELQAYVLDNGCGMDDKMLKTCCDPFATTRQRRRVGLGLALFKLSAERSGGSLNIKSALGAGTSVCANYKLNAIDRPPLGDIAASIAALICAAPGAEIKLDYAFDAAEYKFSTAEIENRNGAARAAAARDKIEQSLNNINGGVLPI